MGWLWSDERKARSSSDNAPNSPPTPGPLDSLADSFPPSSSSSPTQWTTTQLLTSCIIASAITGASTLASARFYNRHFRRVPTVDYLKPHLLRKQALHGYVTSVGDGDNFRLFHTPGGRLAGWGWWRPIPQKRDALADQTIHVRIAGVDAPELAHFGRPAQPFGQDALEWLRASILHRYVRVVPYRRDQYDRVVGTVVLPWRLFRRDLGLEMLRAGMCTVYEAKQFSEFGGKEDLYRREEEKARGKGLGMWRQQQQQQQQQKLSGVVGKLLGKGGAATSYESPRDFKTRTKLEDTR